MARHARLQNPIIWAESGRNASVDAHQCYPTTHNPKPRVRFYDAALAYIASGGESRYLIGSSLLVRLRDVFVCDIDQDLIDEIAQSLWSDSSPATRARQCYGPISAVLKFSAKRGWCDHWRLARPRHIARAMSLPTADELRKFVACSSPHFRDLVIFLLLTGATAREAIRLDWKHVDLANRTALLVSPRNRSRVVDLDDRVVRRLSRLAHRSGPVFRGPTGKPYTEKRSGGGEFKTARNGAAARASVARIGPRILRKIWHKRQLIGSGSDA